MLKSLFMMLAGTLVSAAPHLLGIAYYWKHFDHYVMSQADMMYTDMSALLLPPSEHWLFGGMAQTLRSRYWLNGEYGTAVYMGTVTIALTAISLILIWRRGNSAEIAARRTAGFCLCGGVVCFILACGDRLIIGQHNLLPMPHMILRHIPVFQHMRIPGRWTWPSVFMLSMAGSILLQRAIARSRTKWLAIPVAASAVFAAADGVPAQFKTLDVMAKRYYRPALNAAIHAQLPRGGSALLMPAEFTLYPADVCQFYWGYDYSIASGLVARPPLTGTNFPWKNDKWAPGTNEWLKQHDVRIIVLFYQKDYDGKEIGNFRDWTRQVKRDLPKLAVLNEDGKVLE